MSAHIFIIEFDWLIFVFSSSSRSSAAQSNNTNSRQDSPQRPSAQSIQVLQYEAELLEERIETLEDDLTPDQIEQLRMKHKALKEQTDRVVKNLREGGKQGVEGRIISILFLLIDFILFLSRSYSRSSTITRTLHSRRRRLSSTK
jgi:TolA-binding protein